MHSQQLENTQDAPQNKMWQLFWRTQVSEFAHLQYVPSLYKVYVGKLAHVGIVNKGVIRDTATLDNISKQQPGVTSVYVCTGVHYKTISCDS